MDILTYILLFSLLGGVISLIGGVLLLSNHTTAKVLARYATPFAGGALLAAVFLDLLPESILDANNGTQANVLLSVLIGIVVFFFAEGFLHWFHHHHEHGSKRDPSTWLIIIGDTMHNALDGVAIAASFMISIPVGIVTTVAVAAHEIPQEIGDFGLLLAKGMKKRKVLLINIFSALATTLAALITYLIGSEEKLPLNVLLGLSAGFLLYIALSDIIPTIHEKTSRKKTLFAVQAVLLIMGLLAVGIANKVAHQYIDTNHTHNAVQSDVDTEDHHEHDEKHPNK